MSAKASVYYVWDTTTISFKQFNDRKAANRCRMKTGQPIPPLNLGNNYANGRRNPLPMQYLGSKARISAWLLDQIQNEYSDAKIFIDLFAGTGSVSLAANEKGYQLCINDIQPYSYVIQRSLFQEPRDGLLKLTRDVDLLKSDKYLLGSGRSEDQELLEEERAHFRDAATSGWNWESYREFCETTSLVRGLPGEAAELRIANKWNLFIRYYANTYFGVEQCLQLDALREYAESLPSENAKIHLLAATIAAMTFAVSSTTHLAQYLKPSTQRKSISLIRRRGVNLVDEVKKRLINLSSYPLPDRLATVYQKDFRELLAVFPLDSHSVLYIDPPYFKEHYSRYYHVLDTFYLYDYPELTFNDRIQSTTIGRYRQQRIVSDFGLKSLVEAAFADIFLSLQSSGAKAAISYAETSLVKKDDLLNLATEFGLKASVKEIDLMHSGQGQPRNKIVKEYLFLLGI